MTYFLNFRTQNVGGAVIDPYLLRGDGTTPPPAPSVVPATELASIFLGRRVLFATHGFNVSYQDGASSLGQLDRYLDLAPPSLFVGVLWPGDCWLPVVDYPFEGNVATDCGQRLAVFCNTKCRAARSISFLSHSLGARLVLEAIARLGARADSVCLTAAAINRDCLAAEYKIAADKAAMYSVLASHNDNVLKIAFPLGDPFADLLHSDHTPFRAALGYDGPSAESPGPVGRPWQIPDDANYGHHDYLPPGSVIPGQPAATALWPNAVEFMKRAFLKQPQSWPPDVL